MEIIESNIEAIDNHISKMYSDQEVVVYHEIVSDIVHLDVNYIKSDKHNFNILLTSGMSSLAMNVNESIDDWENYRYAEIMLLLPKELEIFTEFFIMNSNYDWIMGILKNTARFPHEYNTWIRDGHTIQANENFQSYYPETEYSGVMILSSMTFDDKFTKIKTPNGEINIYSIYPLYKPEIEYKIKHGTFEMVSKNRTVNS